MLADEAAHEALVGRRVQQHSGSSQPGSLVRVCIQRTPTPPSQGAFFPAKNRAFCQACRADVRKKGLTSGRLSMGWGSSRFV